MIPSSYFSGYLQGLKLFYNVICRYRANGSKFCLKYTTLFGSNFSKDTFCINCQKLTHRIFQQAAEIRLQKEKEKEILPVVNTSSTIWSSQNISWGNPSFPNSQWSSSTGRYKELFKQNIIIIIIDLKVLLLIFRYNTIHFQVANH